MTHSLERQGILFLLIGPAGSGKSTVCDRLIQDFGSSVRYAVSVTTRAPRPGEVEGKSYYFVTRERFQELIDADQLFEWEEIHGNLYGRLRSSLINGIDDGHDLLLQIDIRGAMTFKNNFPRHTVTVFILPPSFAVLKERLLGRGAVGSEELTRRIATARLEYDLFLQSYESKSLIDYVVVNRDIETTYDEIRSVVVAERMRYHRLDRESVQRFCVVTDGA